MPVVSLESRAIAADTWLRRADARCGAGSLFPAVLTRRRRPRRCRARPRTRPGAGGSSARGGSRGATGERSFTLDERLAAPHRGRSRFPAVYTYWRLDQLLWERLPAHEAPRLHKLRTVARLHSVGWILLFATALAGCMNSDTQTPEHVRYHVGRVRPRRRARGGTHAKGATRDAAERAPAAAPE